MALYTTESAVNAVVAEIGGYATKIGYAGEDCPRAYFRSVRRGRCRVKRCDAMDHSASCVRTGGSHIVDPLGLSHEYLSLLLRCYRVVSLECRSLTGRRNRRRIHTTTTTTSTD